jgi:hypothetical protein
MYNPNTLTIRINLLSLLQTNKGIMKNKFNIPPSMQGYTIKDGRLINMAPSPEMGITKLAQMRASKKRYDKVQMIAEGNELSQANIDLFKR